MKPVYRGLLVAAVQCAIVLSVAGKYQLDGSGCRGHGPWLCPSIPTCSFVDAMSACSSGCKARPLRRTNGWRCGSAPSMAS